jgi:PIN domain nuclease of toxin-antitoxin system
VKYLVDTHVWLWLLESPTKLAPAVRTALEYADDLVLSAASVWELAIKVRLGKIDLSLPVNAARDEFLAQSGARELAIQSAHALAAAELPLLHRDPFDRLLMAQAQPKGSPWSAPTRPSVATAFPCYGRSDAPP